jgi:hypothetical protein
MILHQLEEKKKILWSFLRKAEKTPQKLTLPLHEAVCKGERYKR